MTVPVLNNDVWVIVPTFNEAPVVRGVLRQLLSYFPNVVAVDDGSTDGSAAEIVAAGARLVRHGINLGAGAAIQTGIDFALLDPNARYFVTFDADGQHRASDAVAMVERLRRGEHQIILGSRFLGASTSIRASRRLLLHGARAFEWMNAGIRLTDAHNGLRVFSRTFAESIKLTYADMAHASQLLTQVAQSGLPYVEHPVTVDYTEYSRRKGQRSVNAVNIAVDVWLNRVLRERA
jgi:polyprenyl-phospho-N-acetylgalactosaminyl synthase